MRAAPRCCSGGGDRPHLPWDRRSVLRASALPLLPLLAPASLADAVRREGSLWGQEAALYARRAQEALGGALPSAARPPPGAARAPPRLDARFAAFLLEQLPRSVEGLDAARWRADVAALRARELPAFQAARACGHCGAVAGPAALGDPAWWDFLWYTALKAVALQLRGDGGGPPPPPEAVGWEAAHAGSPEAASRCAGDFACASAAGAPPPPPAWAARVRRGLGKAVLAEARREVDLADAAAEAISPVRAGADDALLASSAELDSVRRGAAALARFMERRGAAAEVRFAFFGASRDEERNHATWEAGEPAFLRLWARAPAGARAAAALEAEEGAGGSADPLAAAVEAYLADCGVDASRYQRFVGPAAAGGGGGGEWVAHQWTLRRRRALPARRGGGGGGAPRRRYAPFAPDACPEAGGDACA